MTELTQAIVRELLDYDPATGALTWRRRRRRWFTRGDTWKSWNSRRAGTPAFTHVHRNGRLNGFILGQFHYAHRVIWLWMTGRWPNPELDHRNRNPTDNRWRNLREVGHSENQRNRSLGKNNQTGRIGVCRTKHGSFRAQIAVNGRLIYLVCHKTLDAAALARQAAEQRYGFAAGHGRPRARSRGGR
jgi:hypothetical protein